MLRSPVWTVPAFRRLWVSQSVSELGSAVTILVLPLIAVSTLHATPWQVGVLLAAQAAPFLIVGLPAGALVDRWSLRRTLIVTDAIRALALGSVPLAAVAVRLTIAQLVLVGMVIGTCKVFFDIAYQSFLPEIVDEDHLEDGNAALSASQSVGEVAGPPLGGVLAALVGAPWALMLDAVSFVWSVVWLVAIREPAAEPSPGTTARPGIEPLRRQVAAGLRFVFREPRIRATVTSTATCNFAVAMSTALGLVFLVRDLGASGRLAGVLFGAGGVGGFFGAFLVGPLTRRFGRGPAIWIPLTAVTPLSLAVPFLTPSTVGLYGVIEFLSVLGVVAYNIGQVSMRQRLCPPELRGRMNASARFLSWGAIPLGSLVGGALGGTLGVRDTLLLAGVIQIAGVVPLLVSPLRRRATADLPVLA